LMYYLMDYPSPIFRWCDQGLYRPSGEVG
jgi:hypothetical protein